MQIHSVMASTRFLPVHAVDDIFQSSLTAVDFRILIVNEGMRSADSLKRTLRELGYLTTLTAYSAKRALEAAADFSPSVALLDLELPDMTGFQLAHKLQSHRLSRVRRVPLVAVADSFLPGYGELAEAAGFRGCLTKPVMPMELNRMLCRLHG